jgi:hypothetical protein
LTVSFLAASRLTWTAIFILSFYGMILVFKASYKSYTESAISFVTETAYLNWNTSFPAITLCEITSSEVPWTGQVNLPNNLIKNELYVSATRRRTRRYSNLLQI